MRTLAPLPATLRGGVAPVSAALDSVSPTPPVASLKAAGTLDNGSGSASWSYGGDGRSNAALVDSGFIAQLLAQQADTDDSETNDAQAARAYVAAGAQSARTDTSESSDDADVEILPPSRGSGYAWSGSLNILA